MEARQWIYLATTPVVVEYFYPGKPRLSLINMVLHFAW
jgi:hypothetical protein